MRSIGKFVRQHSNFETQFYGTTWHYFWFDPGRYQPGRDASDTAESTKSVLLDDVRHTYVLLRYCRPESTSSKTSHDRSHPPLLGGDPIWINLDHDSLQ